MSETNVKAENWVYRLAKVFRRDLLPAGDIQHAEQVVDIICTLYTTLMALVGLAWLARVSDWRQIAQQWWLYLLFALIWYLISTLKFYIVASINIGGGPGYANTEGTLETIARWAAVLILGPTVLWVGVVLSLISLFPPVARATSLNLRWNSLRQLTTNLATESFLPLITVSLYRSWGGALPLQNLDLASLAAFIGAVFIQALLELVLIWFGYMAYLLWALRHQLGKAAVRPLVRVVAVGTMVPYLPAPFAALAAWLYIWGGLWLYLFFMSGLILVAFIARQLSKANESSRQQLQQSERLEQLARALLDGPPDASRLPNILKEQAPGMFMSRNMVIWLAPDQYLLKWPAEFDASPLEPVWPWVLQNKQARAFLGRDALPWEQAGSKHSPVVVAPILDAENASLAIGGICMTMGNPALWDRPALQGLLPTLQTLASQISTALHQARVYQETLAYQKTAQELAFARRIQTSFLPELTPNLPGWQVAATLEPARETSGDFYDFISLSGGRLGILIADVADKGLGPALYMALSRTLIRTFAMQLDAPDEVLRAANRRILEDSRADLFVTVFYAVLDPYTNCLSYCNAGHPPPIVFNRQQGRLIRLGNTGMALGIDEEAPLRLASVDLMPGDVIFLYTDGVTDAQNTQGEFIDPDAVIAAAQDQLGNGSAGQSAVLVQNTALEFRNAMLERIRQFVDKAPQFDDITMIVLAKEA